MNRKLSRKRTPLYKRVQKVLEDQRWHCRDHEFSHIPSRQPAGGGGFQTLERGTRSRNAWVLKRAKKFCKVCVKSTDHIRWTGEEKAANAPATMPPALIARVLKYYCFTDTIELSQRPKHQLVIDHRFPMIRWGGPESPLDSEMPLAEIKAKFQLLKKDEGGNHNSLKTRACEKCVKTNKRGTPFGISFFYCGTEDWDPAIPSTGSDAERGCVGCGWYDFGRWRKALNEKHSAKRRKQLNEKRVKPRR